MDLENNSFLNSNEFSNTSEKKFPFFYEYPILSMCENSKGDIDIELILYYKPQSYFYLGLIISGITLISGLAYLIYDWKKNKKERINLEI